MDSPYDLPAGLPVPLDDGACDHLGRGAFEAAPAIALPGTDGREHRFDQLDAGHEGAVVFVFPRTGVPGQPPNKGFAGEEWEEIPGARGCTPQACGFRDLHARFTARGLVVWGLSTNTTEHQREFRQRTGAPFDFLSDADLRLTRALRLPTFEFPVESGGPNTLLRRMALFLERGRIRKVWYPVFPPDRNAATVLHWLERRGLYEELAASTPAPDRPPPVRIREISPRDLTWVREELTRHWCSSRIMSRRVWFDADQLPGFIAENERTGERLGLLTHTPPESGGACEVITLSSRLEGRGVGGRLLDAAVKAARAAGCTRIFLTTSNDNLRAIRFYQKRGWRIVAVHPGAIDAARQTEKQIPTTGMHGIPLRDELELETRFGGRP